MMGKVSHGCGLQFEKPQGFYCHLPKSFSVSLLIATLDLRGEGVQM